ncbi:MAG: hypothetical protein N2C14_00485 [Planctomycetales bacterium]
MRRVIVAGGFGFFGNVLVERLRAEGFEPLICSRRQAADVVLNVEDPASIRQAIHPDDVVVDAAGPYQIRTTALAEAAADVGFDLIDLADSLDYVQSVWALKDRFAASGARVFTACSTVSAISAAMIHLSGFQRPRRVSGLLIPAAKHTAVDATAASLLYSVGNPVRVLADGHMVERAGWRTTRRFQSPPPFGRTQGHLFETADSFALSAVSPSLRAVDFYVNSNVWGLNATFSLASRWRLLRALLKKFRKRGLGLARLLGGSVSGICHEIENEDGAVARLALIAPAQGFLIPIAPAVLAVRSLMDNQCDATGLISHDRQINPQELIRWLAAEGIEFSHHLLPASEMDSRGS